MARKRPLKGPPHRERRRHRPKPWELSDWARRPSLYMWRRLSAAIAEQQDRLDARVGLITETSARGREWTTRVNGMLEAARGYLYGDRILEGWQQIYDVRQAMIDGYARNTLATHRVSMREEARDALTGGRLRAVESLLADGGGPAGGGEVAARAELRMARTILDGHYQGLYLRATHARTQLFYLPIVLALILGALFAVAVVAGSPVLSGGESPAEQTQLVADAGAAAVPDEAAVADEAETTSIVGDPAMLIWVYALGALGALLSVTLSAIRGVTKHNYLLVTDSRVNLTRPLIGAASAAAVAAILETDIFNIGVGTADKGLVLAVAIAAGFSERLVTNAIAAVVPSNGGK